MPSFKEIICARVINKHTFIDGPSGKWILPSSLNEWLLQSYSPPYTYQHTSSRSNAEILEIFPGWSYISNHISIVVSWAVKNIGPFVCELSCPWLVAVGQLVCWWIFFIVNFCELSVGELFVNELSCYQVHIWYAIAISFTLGNNTLWYLPFLHKCEINTCIFF